MSHFEYIMVMVSIIQGLGLTLALRGIGHVIRSPRRETAVILWGVFLVFLYLQNWWAFWDMKSVESWNFLKFLFIALYVCTVYAMTELMLPMGSSKETDWPEHFAGVRKAYYGLSLALVTLGVLLSLYIVGAPLLHPYRIMQLTIFCLFIAGWFTQGPAAHRLIAALVLLVSFAAQIVFRLLPGLMG